MKYTKNLSTVLIPSLFLFLFLSGCISTSRHLTELDKKDLLIEQFPSTWELSTARATQVVRHLIAEEVNPEDLMAVGMSQYSPMALNDSSEGRQMNRRIEIVLVPKEDLQEQLN